jgi:hypothetical protein
MDAPPGLDLSEQAAKPLAFYNHRTHSTDSLNIFVLFVN